MQHITPENNQSQNNMISQENIPHEPYFIIDTATDPTDPESKQTLFYTQESEDELDLDHPLIDDQENQDSPFVLPFQNSAAMPIIAQRDETDDQEMMSSPPLSRNPIKPQRHPFHVLKIFLIVSAVLITVIGASIFVLAEPGHPMQKASAPRSTAKAHATPSPQTSQQQGKGTQETGITSSGAVPTVKLLGQLGWTQAGLSLSDSFEALRTSMTFTDREMSYDYRMLGVPANHSGTLTASLFLLTPGGKVRFAQNDKRAINNDLYDQISTSKMIQQVVTAQPTLVQFQAVQIQGQRHLFAWINVSFELFQSQIDPATGNRTESLERDTATGQPRMHQLATVLVRVSPQTQGANAPMGGTGWLVDTYALDTNTLPMISTIPSL